MASYVQRIKGAIGYVETAYALQNHMRVVFVLTGEDIRHAVRLPRTALS